MKKLLITFIALSQLALAQNQTSNPAINDNSYEAKMKRTEWHRQARFGMFIHFGLYSMPARGEWVRNGERISNEEYDEKYFKNFNPYLFDAKEWAKTAKQAGMKYVVLTAKHHEGFCLWDSKLTDYKVTNTPFKRDIIKEYTDALRAEGIKVGIYFSIIDWHHPDYPKFKDAHHPMRGNEKFKDEKINWDNYIKYMHGQVRELCSNYGKIDVMWYDFSYDDMKGDKWKAKELVEMVRTLQPGVILNNRLGGDGASGMEENSLGDFDTPEQTIPEKPIVDAQGRSLPWESCLTLNNSWGYNRTDNAWKDAQLVIHTLVNCVSKNGNLLLNVGPDANGKIPDESIKILSEVGQWMKKNNKSIYGCGASTLPKSEWGLFTANGKFLFAHRMYPIVGPIALRDEMVDKVKRVTMLADGTEAATEGDWWGARTKKNLYINVQKPCYATYPMPDKNDTVFEIELK
jgi:alpha-L-fucosidase